MYLCLSQTGNEKAYKIVALNQSVYTYEGFCYYMYKAPEVFNQLMSKGSYMTWFREGLGLIDLTQELEVYFETGPTELDKMLKIMSLCPYTDFLDQDEFKLRYKHFIEMPQTMRLKEAGNREFREGNYKAALSLYKESIAMKAEADVYNNIALIYMQKGDYEKAMQAFERALKMKDSLEIQLNRCRLMVITEAYEAALKALNLISKLSMNWQVWYYYGIIYQGLNQTEEALAAYVRCYELSHSMKALTEMIRLMSSKGHADQAMRYIDSAEISQWEADYLRAVACLVTNRGGLYESYMEKALNTSESKTRLLLELSSYYVKHNQLIRAIDCIGKIDQNEQDIEAVRVEKINIAANAGNARELDQHVEALLSQWKKEVRAAVAN